MYLKALEIQGFKSFPDKTILNFGEDITAIVGPNGSGKSNISDAIRWVMGEQNSRQLRGNKMEDVIFGGTETRNQMGFAQVTLVIDNSENIFNRDETEVAVTRRYYRSGESEYYINKQSVRLKDINELFMDTGMGREGYSIISQGKVDEILSAKSGDRREIFEEAAGISKYRHRKEEAERKLEHTEDNLVRINDKISELELQVEPLRKQSEVAKKYLVLRDELRLLEISVWLEQLEAIKVKKIKLENDVEAAKADKERAEQTQNASYAEVERLGEEIRQLELENEQLRVDLSEIENSANDEENTIALLNANISHQKENIERAERELSDAVNRTENLQNQIDEKHSRAAEIEENSRQLEEEIQQLLDSARRLSENAEGANRELEALRVQEAEIVAEIADARAEISALQSDKDSLKERSEKNTADLADLRARLENAQAESKTNKRLLNDAKEEADAVSNIISGHTMKMSGRQKKADEAVENKMKLTVDVGAIENRIRILSEMEKEYEGFSKAVKSVMLASERNILRGVHGPVASLMKTKDEYSVAMEIALGAGLQNIVVDREEDGKAAINFLKKRDEGRATFLPISALRGDILRENLDNEPGFVGIASDLIEYDNKYSGVFKNLLGRTVIVEDLDYGITLARKYHNGFKIVTLDGQVMNRGGSMTGGSINKNSGVLSRANELGKLSNQLGSMKAQLAEAVKNAEEATRELQKAQYELELASNQQHEAENNVLKYQGKQDHYNILLNTLTLTEEDLEKEQEKLSARSAEDEKRIEALNTQIGQKEEKRQEVHKELEKLLDGQSEIAEQNTVLTEKVSEAKALQAANSAEKESVLNSAIELEKLQKDMLEQHNSQESLLNQYRGSIAESERQVLEHKAKVESIRSRADQIRQKINEKINRKLHLEGTRDQKNRESRECNELLVEASNAYARISEKLESSALEENQILDKLWERYELSHSQAVEQRIELESLPKATRRIAELNRQIKDLGTPNIGAIEEFERVNTRYTYLSEQRSDVEKAKDELLGIIEEITRRMTDIFSEQFVLINESFQETFVDLFGGGKATLELEDKNDILNCGIEIKVQPPGKQLKTITLLSGGEKAFVAIALYFSILKVHPTPFCIMDEIEAALDEANVIRVARYMRRIAGKTQFIAITHRRGTMEEADVLYGVTMQERGVSRILTVNLNDLDKELNLKKRK